MPPRHGRTQEGILRELFAHHAALQAFFYRRLRTKSDAADLVQEFYLRMLRVGDTIRSLIPKPTSSPWPRTC